MKNLCVIEELDPYLEEQIKALGIQVIGKDFLPPTGEYNSDVVDESLSWALNPESATQELLGRGKDINNAATRPKPPGLSESIPVRPPTLCPGCSHRGMFYIFKKLHLTVTGDIGCYTLGALPPLNAMDTCLCMGAGVSMAYGLERATDGKTAEKTIAVIGDSTFIHSGITGLVNVVYNQGATTICILDNHTTAMTGHQPHPATGETLDGHPSPQLDFVRLCKSVGVKRVRKVNPFNLEETERVVRKELASKEPSVIISSSPCILNEKIDFGGALEIEPDKCPKCGVCIQLGCSAIGVQDGLPYIDPLLCPGCTLCQQVCKYNAIINPNKPT
jgi:indolepyruvate ferredoxin oxidoreductase alpha subunit